MNQKEIQQLALEMAVDNAWSFVECASVIEKEGETEWFNLGSDAEDLKNELTLLIELKLAEAHPEHPTWIREVAEL